MESQLERILDEVMEAPGVNGVLFTDKHGLCLGEKGHGAKFNSGAVACFADAAAKLDPENKPPKLISLESVNRQCLIKQDAGLTAVIVRTNPTPNTPNL
ncbi:hypothetical protein B566_EDAN001715 [Ephemera danica]|nr:hypothetical protein B566_EDAN001715 [Ephemera danica]